MSSLWGDEFEVSAKPEKVKKIVEKASKPKTVKVEKKTVTKKNASIEEVIDNIKNEVYKTLGRYADDTVVIDNVTDLTHYIDKAIQNKVIAIDTETNNSLQPITCKIMGLCLYTPGEKNAYIPVNHINRVTNELLPNQVTEEDIRVQLERINEAKTDIIMHNGKFDYEVLKCTCNVECVPMWDTMVASKILDENESAKLKDQYRIHIDSTQEKYDIEHLFEKMEYAIFDPALFALYAATDSFITYKLYVWQKEQFAKLGNEKLYWVFKNIEMPVVEVVANMELTGVEIDKEYGKRLSEKYHKKLSDLDRKLDEELVKLKPKIDGWRARPESNYHVYLLPDGKTKYLDDNDPQAIMCISDGHKPKKSKNEQLADPPQVTSPTQLAILMYDVFDVGVIDKKSPRGTGEDILVAIEKKYPELKLCSLILEKRGLEKLIGTYIDKIPECVCEKDNRLHAHFNQYGAGTGRFSSSDPNLQNIPSHNQEIRLLFKAAEGKMFVGSDFSQQEPRLLSEYSQDPNMLKAYNEGKDLYATLGAGVYKMDYWDCMEHHEDGSANPDGAKRRKNMKVLLLGIMYGMGASSIANDLGITTKEANQILEDFYKGFPRVKEWQEYSREFAKKNGYSEDFWGRRRRLPKIQLPEYEIINKNAMSTFNPLLDAKGIKDSADDQIIQSYISQLQKCRSNKDKEKIKADAMAKGYIVKDNGGFISQAERECVNARVQGGAASMTKLAMRKLYDDKELTDLGFKIVLQIHDEIIGECPEENAERCCELLTRDMRESVKEWISVPFKCDGTLIKAWYIDEYENGLKNDFSKLINGDPKKNKPAIPYDEALSKIINDHTECTVDQIYNFLGIEQKDN